MIAESSSGRRCRPSLSGSMRRGRSWASTPKPHTIASVETLKRSANSPHTGKLFTNVTSDVCRTHMHTDKHTQVHSHGWNQQGILNVSTSRLEVCAIGSLRGDHCDWTLRWQERMFFSAILNIFVCYVLTVESEWWSKNFTLTFKISLTTEGRKSNNN